MRSNVDRACGPCAAPARCHSSQAARYDANARAGPAVRSSTAPR